MKNPYCIFILFAFFTISIQAQIISVGDGSYTTIFPGVDEAGRNSYPAGTPLLSGNAAGKPVPTNDWWSKKIQQNHVDNLFNYPFTLKTVNEGLVVSYIPNGVIDDLLPVTVGLAGLNADKATVSNYSDWTVTMNWDDQIHSFDVTTGMGMPFLYFTKKNVSDVVKIAVTSGNVTINNEVLIITNAKNGADFALYAPTGSTWIKNGGIYTSTLNGKNYWSLAFIPLTAENITSVANEYKKYAYVFPVNTTVNWSYDEIASVVRTDFNIQTETKEGVEKNMLIGLLPHQWANLASNSPKPNGYSYSTIRGEMKTMDGNNFSVENTFHGILPTLPYVDIYSEGFQPSELANKISSIQNDALDTWTDTYNEGQMMNRLIQTGRIADLMGNIEARDKIVNTIKSRLEDWLKADNGEIAFLFYYNSTWSSLLGYPAGHGQDSNLNDHHFHWGYFIHAAAFVEQYQPGWAAKWGEMVNMLIRDAADTSRNDSMFPFMRNFNPYAGHCWANGFATFPQGNDQESTSESMQFNSSLIHWGMVTNNKAIRDLGIYLYTTEQTAIEEYWMDIHNRNFPSTQKYSIVSRIWGNSFDNGTFWTGDIAASYGIELYPMHGGSLYLGQHWDYVNKLWNEIKTNTGILNNEVNPNLWHDVMWEFASFIDPGKAIELYNSNPNRSLKFGISDAQTYHWLHSMNALGKVDANITADYPMAAAFNQNGEITYVAYNYSNAPIVVQFSTGYQLTVPAKEMATSKDSKLSGTLTSSFGETYTGGSVQLSANIEGGTPAKVEFVDGSNVIGTITNLPYTWNATNLTLGMHSFYARVYESDVKYTVTNTVEVQVGNQLPFGGATWNIPGTIESGKFDVFEGGKGQNIAYFDNTLANQGDYRLDEAVDAGNSVAEGATVGWITADEWLEYTINVLETGMYAMDFRYASANTTSRGPFHLELDGRIISSDITVPVTSAWDAWATKTVNNIPLVKGKHILRVAFTYGEFNLGKMTFIRTGNIPYNYPVANAGEDIKVILPQSSAMLDGSASLESGGKLLTYKWIQIYGPNTIQFSNNTVAKPNINNLIEGIYKFKLIVTNPDGREAEDDVFVIVSNSGNIAPTVSFVTPVNNSTYTEGKEIAISVNANDFDGQISKVDFYQNNKFISSVNQSPYTISWTPPAGDYVLTAIATDNNGTATTSVPVNVAVKAAIICSGMSIEASQGSFTNGYKYSFETVGNNVNITFELLDNKTAVVAYLWKQTPFGETSMNQISDKVFTATLNNLEAGSTITYACKFAFAGGMSVTKYLSYTVGTNCSNTGVNDVVDNHNFFSPNPVESELNITLEKENNHLLIYNVNGKKVYDKIIPSTYKLDMRNFHPGIYFLKVDSENKTLSTKIIKK
ncbi:Glycosyl hydrolase family 81 [uncultured Paludibacter sp.]|nr:Glycosyl hydrolase family 81 [uncultured Paludibacter sp.]